MVSNADITDLASLVNEHVKEVSIGMNPSTVNLLLYGPKIRDSKGKEIFPSLDKDAKGLLEKRLQAVEGENGLYMTGIAPNIPKIIHTITGKGFQAFGKKPSSTFTKKSFEEIRDLYETNFNPANIWLPDEATQKGLFSNEPMKKNTQILFAYDSNFMLGFRLKAEEKKEEKYGIIWVKTLTKEDRERYAEYCWDCVSGPLDVWEKNTRAELAKKYSRQKTDEEIKREIERYGRKPKYMTTFAIDRLQLGDIAGLRLLPLKHDMMIDLMKKLSRKIPEVPGFYNVDDRTDDCRYRWNESPPRPGGCHIQLVDKGQFLPLEIQVWDLRSCIIDMCGKRGAHFYALEGKKGNLKYQK